MKNPNSRVWTNLGHIMVNEELEYVRNYFHNTASRYSYRRDGHKRTVDLRSTSEISQLCYKVNKNV